MVMIRHKAIGQDRRSSVARRVTFGGMRDELAQLQKRIRKRGNRLRRDALELGRRFYAEPPKAFAKRISIFLEDWASKKKKRRG